MGKNTSQIEGEIAAERNDLGKNIAELENKAKALTDWRNHFQKSPMTMLGLAFGGGVLLATMVGGGRSRYGRKDDGHRVSHLDLRGTDPVHHHVPDTWDHVKGTLFGLASSKVVELLDGLIPGFQDQFGKHRGHGATIERTKDSLPN